MEDGTPVVGAAIQVLTVGSTRPVAKGKSKKGGKFNLTYFPVTENAAYKFLALSDGLLMNGIKVKLLDEEKDVGAEFDFEIGPMQELQEFEIRVGGTAVVDLVMIDADHYAKFLVIPGDKTNTDRLTQANKLSGAGQYDESTALLRQILDSGVEKANIYFLLGRNAFSTGQTEDGAKWFEKTLELDPDMAGVHGQLGVAAHDRGDNEEALRQFELELENEMTAPVEINRASVLIELGRREEAIAAFQGIIERYPAETPAYAELASLYLEEEQMDQAAAVLKQMEATGKPDPKLWFNIGANFSNRGQYDEAEKAYRRSLDLNPDFVDAVRELGFLQIRTGDPAAALEYLQKYLAARPDAPDAGQVGSIIATLEKNAGN